MKSQKSGAMDLVGDFYWDSLEFMRSVALGLSTACRRSLFFLLSVLFVCLLISTHIWNPK
jgi:hypothetical protein